MVERKGVKREVIEEHLVPLKRESDFYERDSLFLYVPQEVKTDMAVGDPESNVALITGWESPSTAVDKEALALYGIMAPVRTPHGINVMVYNLLANPHINSLQLGGWSKNDDTEIGQRSACLIKNIFDPEKGIDERGNIVGSDFFLSKTLVETIILESGEMISPEEAEEQKIAIDIEGQVIQDNNPIGKGVKAICLVKERLSEIRFTDERDSTYEEVMQKAKELRQTGQSDKEFSRVVLPEIKIETPDSLPSEEVGMQVRTLSKNPDALVKTWMGFLHNLIQYGDQTPLEHKGALVRELAFFEAILETDGIESSNIPDWLSSHPELGITPKALQNYYKRLYRPDSYMQEIFSGVKKFVNPEPEKYLYAELVFAYPRDKVREKMLQEFGREKGLDALVDKLQVFRDEGVVRSRPDADLKAKEVLNTLYYDGQELTVDKKVEILLELYDPPINQYEILVNRLKESPEDADKMLVLWQVPVHGMRDHKRPCFVLLNALLRNGELDAQATYRSNDMGQAWLFNAYSTACLVQDMANEAGVKPGKLVMRSDSAHVYNQNLPPVIGIHKKQHEDSIPSKRWNDQDSDPRGNILISTLDNKILVTLVDPIKGIPLKQLSGRNYREVLAEVNHSGIISQPEHALDIGVQILAADYQIRLQKLFEKFVSNMEVEVQFKQDQPVKPILAVLEVLKKN